MNKLPPNPRLLIQGDVGAAAPYVGLAKKLARQCYKSGIRAKSYLVAAETLIRVENYPESYLSKVFIESMRLRKFFIENGLLYLRSIETVYSYFLYTIGNYLINYYSGAGTPIKPGSRHNFYLNGPVFFFRKKTFVENKKNIEAKLSGHGPYDSYWFNNERLENKPIIPSEFLLQLEIERYYNLLAETPRVTLSSNYTGLLRLAVQSWMGVGRSPGSAIYLTLIEGLQIITVPGAVCPYPFADPFNDGLIHDDLYNFWWVRIGFDIENNVQTLGKISFYKMVPKPQFNFIKDLLIELNGESEETKTKYLVALLANLVAYEPKSSDDETVYKVAYAVDLSNAVGGGRAPLGYGWKFNFESPWKASIVTERIGADSTPVNWYREATLAHISFPLASEEVPGEPLLEIEEQDKLFNIPAIHALRRPIGFNVCALVPESLFRAEMPTDDPVPLYCFYRRDNNELEVVEYVRMIGTTLLESPIDLNWSTCGFNSQVIKEGFSERILTTGGYKLRSNRLDYTAGNVSSNYSYALLVEENIYVSSSLNTSNISVSSTSCGTPSDPNCDVRTQIGIPCGAGSGYSLDVPVGGAEIYNGTHDKKIYSSRLVQKAYEQFCVIPSLDAECCFLAEKNITQIEDGDYTHIYADPENTGVSLEIQYNTVRYRPVSGGSWTTASVSSVYKRREEGVIWSGSYLSENINVPSETINEGETKVVTSRGIFDSDPAYNPGWDKNFWYSMDYPCDPPGAGAISSLAWSSGMIYSNTEEGGGLFFGEGYLNPYDTDVGLTVKYCWIGDA